MGGEWGDVDSAVRESATFDVSVEDYRRAFADAVTTAPAPPPLGSDWQFRAVAAWKQGAAVGLLGGAAWALLGYFLYVMSIWRALYEWAWIAGFVALFMVPTAVLLGLYQSWDERGWRRRFPRERAAWKRPGRMRIRWSDAGIVLAGREGFGSFGWHQLHAWIDTGATLAIFTAVHDPVPVPHIALAAGDLDDLRARLDAAGVPRAWRPVSDEERQLKRVFG